MAFEHSKKTFPHLTFLTKATQVSKFISLSRIVHACPSQTCPYHITMKPPTPEQTMVGRHPGSSSSASGGAGETIIGKGPPKSHRPRLTLSFGPLFKVFILIFRTDGVLGLIVRQLILPFCGGKGRRKILAQVCACKRISQGQCP